ncbi:MAG: hypothetical protein ABR905_00415 [Terracidiphilus sp.]|jgi:hypothetical protein
MNEPFNPTPGRVLTGSSASQTPGRPATGFQRTTSALRTVLPHLLRLLPLLDGNIGSAVSNLLVPPQAAPPPLPPVDLEPVEGALAELKAEQGALRLQVSELDHSLKRLEGRLETMVEVADRAAISQQELLEELRAVGNRVQELTVAGRKAKAISRMALGLLTLSVLLSLVLLLHALHILP